MLTYAAACWLKCVLYIYMYSLALPEEARPKWFHSTQQHHIACDIAVPNRHTTSLSPSLPHPSNTPPFNPSLDVFRIWMGCCRSSFFCLLTESGGFVLLDLGWVDYRVGVRCNTRESEKKFKKKAPDCIIRHAIFFIFLMLWYEEFFLVKIFFFTTLTKDISWWADGIWFVSQETHSQRVHHKHAFHSRRGFS